MKPQCNTSAECLRELARVMDQFGIFNTTDAINSCYVKYCGKSSYGMRNLVPDFFTPSDWQFAIAEVEGKPVFIGDELFNTNGRKWTITSHNDGFLFADIGNGMVQELDPKLLSWNPPKPKTVMVELTVEDAEYWSNSDVVNEFLVRNKIACKKALEQIK